MLFKLMMTLLNNQLSTENLPQCKEPEDEEQAYDRTSAAFIEFLKV